MGQKKRVCVVPLKNGRWKVAQMDLHRMLWHHRAYRKWWQEKGMWLSLNPEMWVA